MNERTSDLQAATETIFPVPYVHELMLPIKTIPVDRHVLDVLKLFEIYSELNAFLVLDEHQQHIGILSRFNPLNLMPRPFADQLFAASTLKDLLAVDSSFFNAPLLVDVDDRINQVMLEVFKLNQKIEIVPVKDNKGIIGIVKVKDIVARLLDAQNRLIASVTEASARLKSEVETAAQFQRQLLRPGEIDLLGVRGLATLITCSEIGGDFYDYYTVDSRWLVLLVGDASGHGVASGTIVSIAKATVNLLETSKEIDPHRILEYLSNAILKTAQQSLLMTMFVVCLETQTGKLTYANAGHQFPYLYRSANNALHMLEDAVGLPLGRLEDIVYEQYETGLDIGDRLFLYTDAIVEEENPEQECFGYDRLEAVLSETITAEPEYLRDVLLERFSSHVESFEFGDDVTFFQIEFYERQLKNTAVEWAPELDVVYIVHDLYRVKPDLIAPLTSREHLVFLAERNFSGLLPSFTVQGIRRVLLGHHAISQTLDWNALVHQHKHYCSNDLTALLNRPEQSWEYHLTHSMDKVFIVSELEASLMLLFIEDQRIESLVLLLNELLDNAFNAAPRSQKHLPLYTKGAERALTEGETLQLYVVLQDDILGISVIDNWGSLTPAEFLNSLVCPPEATSVHRPSGFHTLWQLSDYLQIRVLPDQQTQVSVFFDLQNPFNPGVDTGFQFLYHTESYESIGQSHA